MSALKGGSIMNKESIISQDDSCTLSEVEAALKETKIEPHSMEIDLKENNNEQKNSKSRHCAVCLQLCPLPKLCGGCKKRAYCSKECQIKDWPSGGQGQGHKNWCRRYECGEEDVDWEVVPVPGKGLGIVAKRTIPAKYRIIVEGVFTDPLAHPGIKDLVPENRSLQEKFTQNAFSGDVGEDDYIALRISRANHSCCPNACHNFDENARVEILFAQREIQAGEEICISYLSFANINTQRMFAMLPPEDEFRMIKTQLKLRGVECSADCFCNDPDIRSLVIKGRKLNIEVDQLASHQRPAAALQVFKELLAIQDTINSSLISKANSHYTAFQVAVMSSKTLPQARKHIQYVHEIYSSICPYSADTVEYEREMKNMKLAEYYLIMG